MPKSITLPKLQDNTKLLNNTCRYIVELKSIAAKYSASSRDRLSGVKNYCPKVIIVNTLYA